jgi:hypothetical protein
LRYNFYGISTPGIDEKQNHSIDASKCGTQLSITFHFFEAKEVMEGGNSLYFSRDRGLDPEPSMLTGR